MKAVGQNDSVNLALDKRMEFLRLAICARA